MSDSPDKAVDYLGQEIKVGDTVCYPMRRGSNMWMNKRIVSQVNKLLDGSFEIAVYDPEGAAQRRTRVRNLHSVIVVTSLCQSTN